MVTKERVEYLDYLRAIATIAVVAIHVACMKIMLTDVKSDEWMAINVYNSMLRWSVPIFVMISGALFLDASKKINITILFKKYISRIVIIFFFWSAVYATVDRIVGVDWQNTIFNFISGHYHQWFLILIIGLYIIVPLLRQLVKNNTAMRYFLLLALIFAFIIPQLKITMTLFNNTYINSLWAEIDYIIGHLNLNNVMGYAAYFVAGYYFSKTELTKKMQKVIYSLGLLGLLLTIGISAAFSISRNEFISYYYDYLTINVMMMSIAVFVFGKYKLSKIRMSPIVYKITMNISKYSLGIYLVHVLILEAENREWYINTQTFHALFSTPVIAICLFVVSYIISAILNHIPFVKKYLV